MKTHRYAFAAEKVAPILNLEKTASVRWDDERRPVPGDLIRAVTPDGEPFAVLEVHAVAETTVARAPGQLDGLDACHEASDADDLLERLREHYPDAGLSMASPVRLLVFGYKRRRDAW